MNIGKVYEQADVFHVAIDMTMAWFYQSLEGEQCSQLGEPSKTQFAVSWYVPDYLD